jgi:hypothetical protein
MQKFILSTVALFTLNGAGALELGNDNATVKWNFRYRMEQVEVDSPLKDAFASTLRSRVTLNSASFSFAESLNIRALVEVDHVGLIGGESYNSTVNGNSQFATIADPDALDLNQAALAIKWNDSSLVTLGRQRINLGDQRFIGGVGWRQNEQTFDGVRLTQNFGKSFQIDIANLHNANRVFGPDGANADLHGSFNLVHSQWKVTSEHVLQGYFYDLDFETLPARSSSTNGIDYRGTSNKLSWQLSYASQRDAHLAPTNYKTNYSRMELSYPIDVVTIKGIYERLGSDGNSAFQTPFATLHAFNGFADMFLTTPVKGLEERAVQFSLPIGPVKTSISWHKFYSDGGDTHYGDETDVSFIFDLNKEIQFLTKLALYNTDKFQNDTNKFWLMMTYQP